MAEHAVLDETSSFFDFRPHMEQVTYPVPEPAPRSRTMSLTCEFLFFIFYFFIFPYYCGTGASVGPLPNNGVAEKQNLGILNRGSLDLVPVVICVILLVVLV